MCRIYLTVLFSSALFLALGCGDGEGSDGGVDLDAAARDGGGGGDAGDRDGGPGTDAGDFDAGDVDAGATDGGGTDAGALDAGDPCADLTLPSVTTENITAPGGWDAPVFLTYAPGSDDLYVVEQPGRIRRIATDGSVSDFLDISSNVQYGGEQGLLGLAFHPDYAANGRFFLFYTPRGGTYRRDNHVGEFRRSDPTTGDPSEVRSIASIADPESNHNGGMLAFGRDGFLYVGIGDGGGAGDAHGAFGNGLNTDTIFGKILRLDVDNDAGMFVAAGNPFIGGAGDDRIWAYGLRNPWRFSFDRLTGDLYIGDVGQGSWEEIDFQPASSTGGENYGWRAYEGYEVYRMADVGRVPVHTEPIRVYDHGGGACSVTGGYVYRGSAIAGLGGWYFHSDFCTGQVTALKVCEGAAVGVQSVSSLSGGNVSSFGEGPDGELYIIGFNFVRRIIGG
ncbi:MAG: PQQ-dependent sugar dehydrogenase [Sandaracinaceae bacterium]|nr:PQQ-dependent sugar dehydrogenase [Sandaracinaceae bacterium]